MKFQVGLQKSVLGARRALAALFVGCKKGHTFFATKTLFCMEIL
jgi:hypothetical protein